MKLLYAVQATGNGHITRARALLPALQRVGIDVDFLFSGRAKAQLFDMQCFGDYRHYEGFTFITRDGKVSPWQTLRQAKPKQFLTDVSQLDLGGYDLLLNDFEPVSAWAAKRQKIPSLGLAHQYALRYPLPGTERARWLKHAIDFFTPLDRYLGIHWQAFDQPILPPLISVLPAQKGECQNFVLVYLPFECRSKVISWLQRFPNIHFVLYAEVIEPHSEGNVDVRPLCRRSFPQALQQCQGVICNTGFGLCSEALMLGKKILTKPLQGQIEQYSNARILEIMGRATVMQDLDASHLATWLTTESQLPVDYPDVAEAIALWLLSGGDAQGRQLAESLWSRVK